MRNAIAAPLPPTAAALANPATARAWKAAQDFEAQVLGEMLAPIFATVHPIGGPRGDGPFGGGQAEETWRPMLSQEMGRHIARHGGLGLATPVFHQILRLQEAADRQNSVDRAGKAQAEPTP